MKTERIIEFTKALLERETDALRQRELLTNLIYLKDDRIKELQNELTDLKLTLKYKKVG